MLVSRDVLERTEENAGLKTDVSFLDRSWCTWDG